MILQQNRIFMLPLDNFKVVAAGPAGAYAASKP